ncbi:3-dehydroquinate synthase [Alicyclobacillus curvatus]|jgi:3-dehydroquinate synthase|nr:3-dehydroquinate synthase [Alicyclobacillus curvatus]
MNEVIQVKALSHHYPLVIGAAVHRDVAFWLQQAKLRDDTSIFIITDENVGKTGYPQALKALLEGAGYRATMAVVSAGDASKSLETAQQLYRSMLQVQIRRNDVVMAVGGGMVGDLAGFVAATYLRGLRFVQVPTTLLAHDSSIGGKVGVNLAEGKNLVGAFHQPILVLYDTEILSTLPQREWTGGLAELIKHGLIGNPELFADLAKNPCPTFPGPDRTTELVADAARVKIGIIEEDERESGIRMVLNVGHTVGHAIEQESGYTIHHGEAVAMGLAVESELSFQKGWLSQDDRDQIFAILCNHGLPNGKPDLRIESVLETMNLDKKHEHAAWTFALPYGIGDVRIVRGITKDEVVSAWDATPTWKAGQGR